MSDEPELFEALSVKYVLAGYQMSRSDLEYLRSFGDLHLYRFIPFRDKPFSLAGDGDGALVAFEPEHIRIRLDHTSPQSRIRIHVADFDRWDARINNTSVPIERTTVYGNEYPFLMELPARDGELDIRYVRRAPDWAWFLLSLAALPLLAGIFVLPRTKGSRFPTRVEAWVDARSTRLRLGLLGACLVVVAALTYRAATPRSSLPSNSLFQSLPAHAIALDGVACVQNGPTAWTCGQDDLRATVVKGIYGAHYCMSTSSSSLLTLDTNQFVDPFVDGQYDSAAKESGHIRVTVNDATLGDLDLRQGDHGLQMLRFDARPNLKAGPNSLHIEVSGAALHCFDLLSTPAKQL
jgi:hypothetical protein